MGVYKFIESIGNKPLFKYILIIIAFLFFFKNRNIGLNIILALFLACLVIFYLYEQSEFLLNTEEKEYEAKFNNIKPKSDRIINRKNYIDFFFSIQDLYVYNPEAYEEMMDNVDAFFTIYTIMHKGTPYNEHSYQIAESKKNNAINALHSMIFSLPNDPQVTDKLNRAHKRLETLLTDRLNVLYDIVRYNIIQNGRNIQSQQIDIGPKPANNYFDKDFTYQLY